jgi:hypothetical protein
VNLGMPELSLCLYRSRHSMSNQCSLNHPCHSPLLPSRSLSFKRFPHQNSACVWRDSRACHTLSARDICLSIPLPVNIARASSLTKIGNLMIGPESCTWRWSDYCLGRLDTVTSLHCTSLHSCRFLGFLTVNKTVMCCRYEDR